MHVVSLARLLPVLVWLARLHACALKCGDLGKKAFINHLFCPQAILLSNSKEKTPGQKFTTFFKKIGPGDQNFWQAKISMTGICNL